jgi:hypothetical protein
MTELTRRQLERAAELEERAAHGIDVEYSIKWAHRHRAMAAAAMRDAEC